MVHRQVERVHKEVERVQYIQRGRRFTLTGNKGAHKQVEKIHTDRWKRYTQGRKVYTDRWSR